MSNLKIQGHDNLEKDPVSGAILLSPQNNITDIKLSNLMKKVKILEKQNEEILKLLQDLCDRKNRA